MSIRLFLIVCLTAAGASVQGEAPPAPVKPVEAELLARMSSHSVKAGDTIYARVARDWNGAGCRLRRGSTLTATIRAVVPHSRKAQSEVTLAFDGAECGDAGLQPYEFILEAVGSAIEPGGDLTTDLPDPASIGVKTIQLNRASLRVDPPPELRPGEVRGIHGVRITPGNGTDHSTVLMSSGSADLLLELHTRLLLRPAWLAPAAQAPHPTAVEILVDSSPVTVLSPDDTADLDGCSQPNCTPGPADSDSLQTYAGSISLHDLGYVSRSNREISAPGEDEALAWLSPTELLVTFNPHLLVPRYTLDSGHRTARIIRAALIDTAKHKVKRTADWHLADRRQFLWQLPGNRVLVHVDDELRIYRAGLQIDRRIHLAGPLAFARITPDGKLIALGVIRERHAAELHARLVAEAEQEPLEDMQVLLMNDRFETVGSILANSDRLPPVLLNEGQVSLGVLPEREGRPNKHYVLQLRTWDNASSILGHFSSTCMPQVSSLPPDLVFLVTCDKFNSAREYRVLRSDGHPLLHGASYLRELGHAASAGGSPGTFAVRIFRADVPTLPGEPFHAGDLESAELIIYSSADGKRLFSIRAKDPAACAGGYAVSPAGEVAILTRDDVDVYTVPRK